MEGNKITTIEEAREFFGNSENAGKSCKAENTATGVNTFLSSLEDAETFYSETPAAEAKSEETNEEAVNAGNGEASPAEEAKEENVAEETTAENNTAE